MTTTRFEGNNTRASHSSKRCWHANSHRNVPLIVTATKTSIHNTKLATCLNGIGISYFAHWSRHDDDVESRPWTVGITVRGTRQGVWQPFDSVRASCMAKLLPPLSGGKRTMPKPMYCCRPCQIGLVELSRRIIGSWQKHDVFQALSLQPRQEQFPINSQCRSQFLD